MERYKPARRVARKRGEFRCVVPPDAATRCGLTLDPQAGSEQAGRRPALVVSPSAYNGKVGLALLCPIQGHPEVSSKSLRRQGNQAVLDILGWMDQDGRIVAVGEASWEGQARAG